jgi:hypothetical protein
VTFVNELLIRVALPTVRTTAMRAVALHAVSPRASGAGNDVPMKTAMDASKSIHLDNPEVWIVDASITVWFHSSQAIVAVIFGVAPEEMLRNPSPFAVPTADLISLPGLAFQV